jgi:hypothetical protein
MATADNSAFIDLFEGGLKTPAFENHIQEIRRIFGSGHVPLDEGSAQAIEKARNEV